MREYVDILIPPSFEKSGKKKTLQQAWKDEDWIGTFNLWIVTENPEPAILYQLRKQTMNWAPNKLDVTAGGHYKAGEQTHHGLREVTEELGKSYPFEAIRFLGRKIHVGLDTEGNLRHNLVDIFMVKDSSSLESYVLEKKELSGLYLCPLKELLKVHTNANYCFEADGIDCDGHKQKVTVTKESFPKNWDDYHYKICLLAHRFLQNEKYLVY